MCSLFSIFHQKKIEFGFKEFKEIDKYCKKIKIEWFCSPWDIDSVKFLRKFKNPYQEVLLDYKGELSINLGAYGVPETYLVDKNFKIIDKQIGPINNDFVEKVLNLR